jgi:hypothetical protein
MIEAIMGVGSGKSFSSVGILSADRPLEICSEISAFLMATHPWQMVNHPEEDSIQNINLKNYSVYSTYVDEDE